MYTAIKRYKIGEGINSGRQNKSQGKKAKKFLGVFREEEVVQCDCIQGDKTNSITNTGDIEINSIFIYLLLTRLLQALGF